MKILEEQEFSARLFSEASDTENPECQIWINGTSTDSILVGAVFEAAVQYQDCYLVFTTNDCPYEESLNIYYLDIDLKVLDQATLAWPYATGSFSLLNTIEPNSITFKFFTQDAWRITLYQKARWVIPYFSEPRGVWRKFKFKRNFRISAPVGHFS